MDNPKKNQNNVVIGSYTDNKQSQSVFHYNPNSRSAQAILSCINPSFILSHKDHIYIVSQIEKGQIITLNNKFELLSRVSTLGNSPCHISINPSGEYLTVCNYNSGSVAVFILEQHKPTKVRCFITHQGIGNSTNQQRQSGPHPHCSLFTPCDKILFVTDLGTDVVYWYSISPQSIKAQQQKCIRMPGSGPRTICHGPLTQKRIFLSCQLDNTIRMLSYNKDQLQLLVAYRISTNPQNYLSEISYWRNQVYIALRGDDIMMIFTDQKDKLVQKVAFKVGQSPRHFVITDYGVIYVACQKDNKVYRYLFKNQKILQIGQLSINQPSVTAILNNNNNNQ